MMSTGAEGRAHISAAVAAALQEPQGADATMPRLEAQYRGSTAVKGKGDVDTYWLLHLPRPVGVADQGQPTPVALQMSVHNVAGTDSVPLVALVAIASVPGPGNEIVSPLRALCGGSGGGGGVQACDQAPVRIDFSLHCSSLCSCRILQTHQRFWDHPWLGLEASCLPQWAL